VTLRHTVPTSCLPVHVSEHDSWCAECARIRDYITCAHQIRSCTLIWFHHTSVPISCLPLHFLGHDSWCAGCAYVRDYSWYKCIFCAGCVSWLYTYIYIYAYICILYTHIYIYMCVSAHIVSPFVLFRARYLVRGMCTLATTHSKRQCRRKGASRCARPWCTWLSFSRHSLALLLYVWWKSQWCKGEVGGRHWRESGWR